MDKLLVGLNEPQRVAVTQTEGPVLILAGAGSGKTKTLTHRMAYLLVEKNLSPANILAVTFTNKAAGEMRSRVLKLLSKPAGQRSWLPFLGTFHSICVRILRAHGEEVGLSRQFVIFDEQDSRAVIKQAIRNLGIDDKRYQPGLIKNLISSAKNELLDFTQYQRLANGPVQQIAAKVYEEYQKLLNQAQALDFDDLLMATVELFTTKPAILKKWQKQFKYILIDEYQDTNHAQYQLVKMLARAHHNICVVGDDWQSIYSWRGANFRNILEFERDYPDTKVIKLEQNYRSTQAILKAAQAVISQNEQRSDKELWTANDAGQPVKVWALSNEVQEAETIVQAIQDGVSSGERRLNDYAVLYRANAQSRSLEEAFIRHGLPYKVIGGVRFYERKEIKDALAYLNFIYQPDNLVAFRRIINLPPRSLGAKSLETFLQWRFHQKLPLLEALKQVEQATDLTPRSKAAFQRFYQLVERFRQASADLNLADLINLVIKRSGYLDYLNDGSILAADRIENVQELISLAQAYDPPAGGDLATFLEEVALMADVDQYQEDAEAVTLMTLHSAKGLEFKVVFIAGMEENVFPHARSLFEPDELEEERRLCYVGMTRAREELYLIHVSARLLHGNVMHNPPARFISEIAGLSQTALSSQDHEWAEEFETPSLDPGDRVEHPEFGVGKVIKVEDDEVVVKFESGLSKRLGLNYAPLKKLS